MTTPRSLRTRLLRHVIVPLAVTWLLGTMLALAVARYFTQQAFDRALLDDAYAVASHVRTADQDALTLGLTATEMSTLLFDQNESLYFAVYLPDGRFLLTTRPPGKVYEGHWEFPGGKLEQGETTQPRPPGASCFIPSRNQCPHPRRYRPACRQRHRRTRRPRHACQATGIDTRCPTGPC